jgi:hypothetical protein
MCAFAQYEVTHQRLRVGSKKSVQPGRSYLYARRACVKYVNTEKK